MKKLITLIVLVFVMAFASIAIYPPTTGKAEAAYNAPNTDSVLICNSKNSYAYHRYICRGLKRCNHSIVKVSKADAIRMGKKKPCGYCYR